VKKIGEYRPSFFLISRVFPQKINNKIKQNVLIFPHINSAFKEVNNFDSVEANIFPYSITSTPNITIVVCKKPTYFVRFVECVTQT
jgi:hypothetical protein